MPYRLLPVVALALLIIWQGGCMTVENGMLVNRCGLWQLFTGKPMIISLGDIPTKIVERTVKEPAEYVYSACGSGGGGSGTSSVIAVAPGLSGSTYIASGGGRTTVATGTTMTITGSSTTTGIVVCGSGSGSICTAGSVR